MILYLFDVDETLEVSGGPITFQSLVDLETQGNILGLCGNWAVVCRRIPYWWKLFSVIGPISITKDEMINQCKTYIPCQEVVMVGNVLGVSGGSDDEGASKRTNTRFIKENDFAAGKR